MPGHKKLCQSVNCITVMPNESWLLRSPANLVFVQQFIKANIKAPNITGFLWGESSGDRWIPLTNDQQGGKRFHCMTSSCACIIPGISTITPFADQIDAWEMCRYIGCTMQKDDMTGKFFPLCYPFCGEFIGASCHRLFLVIKVHWLEALAMSLWLVRLSVWTNSWEAGEMNCINTRRFNGVSGGMLAICDLQLESQHWVFISTLPKLIINMRY